MPATKESIPSLFGPPTTTLPPSPEPDTRPLAREDSSPGVWRGTLLAPFKIALILLRLPFEILRAFHWVPMVAAIYLIWAHGFALLERLWREHVGFAPTFMSVLLCVALTMAATQITSAMKSILDVLTGRDQRRRQRNGKKVEVRIERTGKEKKDVPAPSQRPLATPGEVFEALRKARLDGLAENAEAIVRLVQGFADQNHPLRGDIDDGLRTILGRALTLVSVEPRPERRSPHLKAALEQCEREIRSLRDACEQVFLRALPSGACGSISDVLLRIQTEQRIIDEVGTRLE